MCADACPSVSRSVNPAASAACSSTIEALLSRAKLVSAIAAVSAGTSQHVPVERVRSGAGGRFELTPLPRGEYVLVLTATIVLPGRSSIAAHTTQARECWPKRRS